MQRYLAAVIEDASGSTSTLCFGEDTSIKDVFEVLDEAGRPNVTYLCLVDLDEIDKLTADQKLQNDAVDTIAKSAQSRVYKQNSEETAWTAEVVILHKNR